MKGFDSKFKLVMTSGSILVAIRLNCLLAEFHTSWLAVIVAFGSLLLSLSWTKDFFKND